MASLRRKLARAADREAKADLTADARLDLLLFLSTHPEDGPMREENEAYRAGLRDLFRRAMRELGVPSAPALMRGLRLRRQTYDRNRDGASSYMKLIDAIIAQRVREHGIEQLNSLAEDPAYLPTDQCNEESTSKNSLNGELTPPK